jgi:sugar phosphate isomerase/epimerase
MELKPHPAFRIGTTSYVLPGDIETNVRFLAGRVQDIEIIWFEPDTQAPLLSREGLIALQKLSRQKNFTFTVHLPLDLDLGAPAAAARKRWTQTGLRMIWQAAPLRPWAYIVHVNQKPADRRTNRSLAAWRSRVERSLASWLAAGVKPQALCVETLHYPFAQIYPVVEALDLRICLDIGHLRKEGYSFPDYLDRYWPRTRVVHLHGVCQGKDHQSVRHLPRSWRTALFRAEGGPAVERVITLEIFSRRNLDSSLNALKEYIE